MSDTDPIEWQLLDTDLTTVLAILPAGEQKLYLEMNEPGSGEVRIPMSSGAAGMITSGQFVRAKYRGAFRGGFFVENIKTTDASGGEAGDEWKSISGRGSLALLDDAIVWDDGTIETVRKFGEASKASVLIDLIDEAKARGGLAILNYDFTATLDSDGAAWTDSQPVELTVGKSLLAVARDFARKGVELDITLESDGTFTLHAYKTSRLGSDKSWTIYFRIGTNCREVSGEELGGGIKNVLRVKYPQGFTTVQDSTSITARRRREALISEESAGNSGAAVTFGQSKLDLTKDPQSSINVSIYDRVKPFAFVDYGLGDTVVLDKKGVEADHRVRGMQLAWREDYAEIVLSLNSTIIENEIRMALEIENLRELWTRLTDSGLPIISFWSALGLPGDTITQVNDMVIIGKKLYIAFGNLTDSTLKIGGITARGVAVMDLETGLWSPLSDGGLLGLSGTGKALAAHGNDLYISGDFNNPGGIGLNGALLVRYDTINGTWSDVGAPAGPPGPYVQAAPNAMVVDNGVLYCGATTNIDGIQKILKYTIATNTWGTLGSGISTAVYAIVVNEGNVYAGGAGGVQVFNGSSWSLLSNLGGGQCRALAIWLGNLVAGGNFTSPGNYIAYYDLSGAAWHPFGSGLDGVCYALAVSASDFYVTGAFQTAGGISCSRIAKYNGSWGALQEGLGGVVTTDGYALAIWDLNVIVGGNFERAGDKPAKGIAVYLTTLEDVLNYLDQSGDGRVLHNKLPDVQGGDPDAGELYHLKEDQHGDLTGGGDASVQHGHDGRYPRKWTGKTTAPTAGDDSADGYAVSDRWIDETNNKEYVALDVNVGAAVWTETTGAGGGGSPGGSSGQIQVNESSAFQGYSWLKVDPTNQNLLLGDDFGSTGTIQKSGFVTRDGGRASWRLKSFGASPPTYVGYYARGSQASPSAPLSGDVLLSIWNLTFNGTDFSTLPFALDVVATENHDGTHHGSKALLGIVPVGGKYPDDFFYAVEFNEDGVEVDASHNFMKAGQEYISYLFENAISKTILSDGDKFGFWDEVSGGIRQIPWNFLQDLLTTVIYHGWRTDSAAWSYSSSYVFTISSIVDLAAVYRKGVKVRYKQGGSYKYGIILSSSFSPPNQTINLDPDNSDAIANSAITDNAISSIENPEGFPDEYTLTRHTHDANQIINSREVLTANRTYYVRTDGSDSNDGLTNSAGGAFLTIQKAIDVVAVLDLSIYDVTIQLGDGTYAAAGIANGPFVGNGSVTIQGNSGTPANVVISLTAPGNGVGCITAFYGAVLTVKDLKVTTTTNGHGLYASNGGKILFSNINFGACGTSHFRSDDGGAIGCSENYSITGNATRHMFTTAGIVRVQNVTVTLTGTPAFSTAFADCTTVGVIVANNNTYSGSATGARYKVTLNGVINVVGGGANYFPGNAAGSVATGGQYA